MVLGLQPDLDHFHWGHDRHGFGDTSAETGFSGRTCQCVLEVGLCALKVSHQSLQQHTKKCGFRADDSILVC
jgi:hypothetical protein